ncbi:hypothetical protein METH_08705 [Leisingera methylohalidivorans DSM 14336]|uniref:Uncharacterized protein n=1 Tax=Leisingera methylohalidivorans DSM 14336 TaxID=999552 RepID=V9VZ21_9RHOB|nr:hypothetical protein METH_08705 [Leisingera methylohalidivorans DSM 14336]
MTTMQCAVAANGRFGESYAAAIDSFGNGRFGPVSHVRFLVF